jgi:hypothetical protein
MRKPITMERILRLSLLILPLLLATLACRTFSSAGETFQESKDAIEAVVTLARGVATQHPGLLETAGSFVAEEGQNLAGTAEAFATQNPGLLETAQRTGRRSEAHLCWGPPRPWQPDSQDLIETARGHRVFTGRQ